MPNSVLLHFDGANGSTTFTDVRGATFTPVNGATITTAASRFGAASGDFTGGGKSIAGDGSAGDLSSSSDWTIEASFRGNAASFVNDWFCGFYKRNPQNVGELQWLLIQNGTYLALKLYSSSEVTTIDLSLLTAVFDNAAFHDIAISKVGNSIYYLLDGVLISTTTYSGTLQSVTGGQMIVGGVDGTFESSSHVYVDELRITAGTGRYSGTIAYRTTPFPDIDVIVDITFDGFTGTSFGGLTNNHDRSFSVAGFSSTHHPYPAAKYKLYGHIDGYLSRYFGVFTASGFYVTRLVQPKVAGWRSSVFGSLAKVGKKTVNARGWFLRTRFPKLKGRRISRCSAAGFRTTSFSVPYV